MAPSSRLLQPVCSLHPTATSLQGTEHTPWGVPMWAPSWGLATQLCGRHPESSGSQAAKPGVAERDNGRLPASAQPGRAARSVLGGLVSPFRILVSRQRISVSQTLPALLCKD